ncbi:MAG: hypothetical protein H7Y42_03430 [Chitinophagaceae bacterium]|nr:hypothetical protein [Chitinophagaceae bacterium]
MKMNVTTMKSVRLGLMAIAIALPFQFSVKAASPGIPLDIEVLSALHVKYLGGDNDALFFNIKYDNKAGKNFKLVVLDETGEALFEDNYTKDLDRRLKVPRLTDSEHVIFLIKSVREKTELTYKVKVTTKVVDNASIVRR